MSPRLGSRERERAPGCDQVELEEVSFAQRLYLHLAPATGRASTSTAVPTCTFKKHSVILYNMMWRFAARLRVVPRLIHLVFRAV